MSLLTSDEILEFQSLFSEHFPLFSSFHNITVFKEPRRIVGNPSDNSYPGYGGSPTQSITYEQVTGVYPVMMVKDDSSLLKEFSQTKSLLPKGQIRIKVSGDCKDFIVNGKTEALMIDGDTYNLISTDFHQHYLNLEYFYFTLERTY